jgi:hypothetical protein
MTDHDDPFERAVASEERYEQAIRSGSRLADLWIWPVTLTIHWALVGEVNGWMRAHIAVAFTVASATIFGWVHDEKLGRQPVVSRWRNVVVVRRPGPKL